jgi:hypothetical protein
MVATENLVFPQGRYGRRRDPEYQRRRRWVNWVAGGVFVLLGLGIAIKLYVQYTDPPYEVLNLSTTDIQDGHVSVSFDVRVPAGEGASCTIEGHTRDGAQVGSEVFAVPPGGADQTILHVTHTLVTTARAMTGEVPGCGPAA